MKQLTEQQRIEIAEEYKLTNNGIAYLDYIKDKTELDPFEMLVHQMNYEDFVNKMFGE